MVPSLVQDRCARAMKEETRCCVRGSEGSIEKRNRNERDCVGGNLLWDCLLPLHEMFAIPLWLQFLSDPLIFHIWVILTTLLAPLPDGDISTQENVWMSLLLFFVSCYPVSSNILLHLPFHVPCKVYTNCMLRENVIYLCQRAYFWSMVLISVVMT